MLFEVKEYPLRIRGFDSTIHPLAVHPDGKAAAATEVVALADEVLEEVEDEEIEVEAEEVLDAEVAEVEVEVFEGPVMMDNRELPPLLSQLCTLLARL
jgi:hypothetical protein